MNIFAQKIGIWYENRLWAQSMFETIVEEAKDDIDFSRGLTILSKHEMRITFKDGTHIRFIRADKSCCGQKYTMSFAQDTIDPHFMTTVILASTYGPTYVANNYEDFDPWRTRDMREYIRNTTIERMFTLRGLEENDTYLPKH